MDEHVIIGALPSFRRCHERIHPCGYVLAPHKRREVFGEIEWAGAASARHNDLGNEDTELPRIGRRFEHISHCQRHDLSVSSKLDMPGKQPRDTSAPY